VACGKKKIEEATVMMTCRRREQSTAGGFRYLVPALSRRGWTRFWLGQPVRTARLDTAMAANGCASTAGVGEHGLGEPSGGLKACACRDDSFVRRWHVGKAMRVDQSSGDSGGRW
jgi:hypothetical protein